MADDCTDCLPDDDFAAVLAEEGRPDAEPDPRGTKVLKWGPTLLAPIGKPTGDKRRFAAGALTNRDLPLAVKWQRTDSQGHSGSSVVGTLDGVTYDENGQPFGFGLLFTPDPAQLPRLAEDAGEVKLLLESGTLGPSVDLDDMEFRQLDTPDGEYAAGERPSIEVTRGRISAITFVPIPAFAEAGGGVPLTEMDPEEYQAELAAHNAALTASVCKGWDDLPVADTELEYEAAAARSRVEQWAAGDVEAYSRAFLWRDPAGEGAAAYRFPIADIVDGRLSIIPSAVSTARAILSGERGESIVPTHDQAAMRDVLDLIERRYDGDAELAGALAAMDDGEFAEFSELAQQVAIDDLAGLDTFGARFDALKAKLAAKGISNPAALAGKIGFHKYGKKGMARLRAGVAARKVKPLHGVVTAASLIEQAMVAAATLNDTARAPLPAPWFDDPKLSGPTPWTVTPEGRVYGHLAAWGTCHTGFPGTCVTPPKSRTNYAYFHTGAVDTTDGQRAVGRVTIGGGHADTRLGFQASVAHYDDTSTQAAVVRAGEDKYGIWVAGALVPGADRDAVMRSPLSGDWRRIAGGLELTHALAVNSPGFPIPRGNLTASGEQTSLVAAGVLAPSMAGGEPAPIDVAAVVVQAVDEYRRAEAAYARRAQALSVLAKMDDDADDSDLMRRRLKAKQAAKAVAMAAPGGGY